MRSKDKNNITPKVQNFWNIKFTYMFECQEQKRQLALRLCSCRQYNNPQSWISDPQRKLQHGLLFVDLHLYEQSISSMDGSSWLSQLTNRANIFLLLWCLTTIIQWCSFSVLFYYIHRYIILCNRSYEITLKDTQFLYMFRCYILL